MDDYQSEEFLLRERFQKSCTIPGTRTLHSSMPSPNSVEKKVAIPEGGEKPKIKLPFLAQSRFNGQPKDLIFNMTLIFSSFERASKEL